MSSINKVFVLGRVGKDPEIKQLPDGSYMSTFTLATSEVWNDKKTGERKEKTEWHKIVVMNDRITDIISKYVRKGSKLMIEGQLHTRSWTDKSSIERFTTEIVLGKYKGELTLLDSKSSEEKPQFQEAFPPTSGNPYKEATKILDDEVPF